MLKQVAYDCFCTVYETASSMNLAMVKAADAAQHLDSHLHKVNISRITCWLLKLSARTSSSSQANVPMVPTGIFTSMQTVWAEVYILRKAALKRQTERVGSLRARLSSTGAENNSIKPLKRPCPSIFLLLHLALHSPISHTQWKSDLFRAGPSYLPQHWLFHWWRILGF